MLKAVDRITRPFKDAQTATSKLAGQIKETRQRIKALNDQAGQIDGFKKSKNALNAVTGQIKQARIKMLALQREFKNSTPSAAQSKQLQRLKQDITQLSAKQIQLSQSTKRSYDELIRAGISTRNLGRSQGLLRNELTQTNGRLKQQQEQLKRTAEQQRRLSETKARYNQAMQNRAMIAGNGYAAYATGRQIARTGVRALGVGYEFDSLMSQTQAVTRIHDKDNPKLKALREQARTLPLSSKFTDSEVAAGQFYLARTGYDADKVLKAMPAMLNLATAGDLDLGTTADIASNIQTAMGIPAEKMDHVADVMTALFTRNNVDIQMLGESLKYSAGVGREFGQSLETVAASTAMLGSAGIQGSMAGTTMRSVLTRIGTSSTVKKLGVKTTDEDGNMRDLVEILKDIDTKTAHMGNVERAAIFNSIAGKNAVTGFSVLMRAAGDGTLEKMRGAEGEYDGEAIRVAQTMMDNLKGDMTILHAGLENISVELFEKNNEWLRKTAKWFSDILHSVAEFLKENPKISKAIVMAGAALAAITTVTGGLMIGIVGLLAPLAMLKLTLSVLGIKGFSVFGLLTKGVKMLGGALSAVGKIAMRHPVLALITLIAGGVYLIYKNWDWLKAKFTYLVNNFGSIVKGLFERIKNLHVETINNILAFVKDWQITKYLQKKWAELVETFNQLKADLMPTVIELTDSIKQAHIDAFNAVLAAAEKWPLTKFILDNIRATLHDLEPLKDEFINTGKAFIDWIIQGIDEGWQQLKNKLASITDILPDSIKSFIGVEKKSAGNPAVSEFAENSSNNNVLSNYKPVSGPQPIKTITDNSKTEYNITLKGGDPNELLTQFKRIIADNEREKEARQRGLLVDIR